MTTDDSMLGMEKMGEQKAAILATPSGDHEVVDVTDREEDSVMKNCRFVYADVTGLCKFGYVTPKGESKVEVKQFVAGEMYPIRNVTKVYRWTDEANQVEGTTQVYMDNGDIVRGLKLRR